MADLNTLRKGTVLHSKAFEFPGVSMKQNRNRRQHRIALGLFCVFSLFATESYAAPAEIASRTPNVGGVQLHYLTAGKGPAVLLFTVTLKLRD